MSEKDESRPLTRRERRMREMAEAASAASPDQASDTQGVEFAPVSASGATTPAPPQPSAPADADDEIEISPYDEHGNPRTRREIRELREAALAERAQRAAARAAQEAPAPAPSTPHDSHVGQASAEEVGAHAPPDVDEELAPTQAFSRDDLAEALGVADETPESTSDEAAAEDGQDGDLAELLGLEDESAEAVAPATADFFAAVEDGNTSDSHETVSVAEHTDDADEAVDEAIEAASAADEPEPKKAGLFARLRGRGAAVADDSDTEEPQQPGEEATEPAEAAGEADEPADVEQDEATPANEGVAEAEVAEVEEEAEYSFPDIAPLEENRSVFDDPTVQTLPAATEGRGIDFEDMITRAVTEEGTAQTSGTASLILPSLPENEGLSGPLGETGELYITGSFELPKSLGETGGHSRLQDAGEHDPFVDAEGPKGLSIEETDSMPVSALQAVSSRAATGSGLITPETKKDNKKAIILASSGGALLILIIGGAVWAWNAGLFG